MPALKAFCCISADAIPVTANMFAGVNEYSCSKARMYFAAFMPSITGIETSIWVGVSMGMVNNQAGRTQGARTHKNHFDGRGRFLIFIQGDEPVRSCGILVTEFGSEFHENLVKLISIL